MKVYFYGLEGTSQLRTGFVNIWGGASCELSLLNLPKKEALVAIQKLKINRVMSIPVAGNSIIPAAAAFKMHELLDALNGLTPADEVSRTGPAAPKSAAASFEQADQLNAAMRTLLSRFLGGSAEKIALEAANKAPPHENPVEFMRLLRAELGKMLGPGAAAQQIAPVAKQFNLDLS
jgi:hypothetical protein